MTKLKECTQKKCIHNNDSNCMLNEVVIEYSFFSGARCHNYSDGVCSNDGI